MDLDDAKLKIAAARSGRGVALDVLSDLLTLVGSIDDALATARQRITVLNREVQTLKTRIDSFLGEKNDDEKGTTGRGGQG